jgi:hypothetical protein
MGVGCLGGEEKPETIKLQQTATKQQIKEIEIIKDK